MNSSFQIAIKTQKSFVSGDWFKVAFKVVACFSAGATKNFCNFGVLENKAIGYDNI